MKIPEDSISFVLIILLFFARHFFVEIHCKWFSIVVLDLLVDSPFWFRTVDLLYVDYGLAS